MVRLSALMACRAKGFYSVSTSTNEKMLKHIIEKERIAEYVSSLIMLIVAQSYWMLKQRHYALPKNWHICH